MEASARPTIQSDGCSASAWTRGPASSPGHADFKTRLQELAARLGLGPPSYDVTTSGPAHHRQFRAEVRAGDEAGVGAGSTKKDAEQQAAAVAYAALTAKFPS